MTCARGCELVRISAKDTDRPILESLDGLVYRDFAVGLMTERKGVGIDPVHRRQHTNEGFFAELGLLLCSPPGARHRSNLLQESKARQVTFVAGVTATIAHT